MFSPLQEGPVVVNGFRAHTRYAHRSFQLDRSATTLSDAQPCQRTPNTLYNQRVNWNALSDQHLEAAPQCGS